MNARGEKTVANLMIAGILLILGGIIFFAMLFIGGIARMAETKGSDVGELLIASIAGLCVVVGIVFVILALVMGFKMGQGNSPGSFRQIPECLIHSRFAVNSVGEMIFGNFEFDAPGGQLFVQVRFPDGHVEELKTAWGVFCQCGEGMRGAAMVKSGWLASFAPLMNPSSPAVDPYAR